MQTKWKVTAGVLAVAALVATGYIVRPHGGPDADKAGAVPLLFKPQEVVSAQVRDMARRIEFSGPLVAPDTVVVRAKAAGTLQALAVAEGARVHRGQSLGQLDLADLQARLSERQAMSESARAAFVQAERTHASNQHLADQQFISPIALESSKAALESARAQLAAAKAQADTVRIALREAALVAPIDAIVAKRQVVPGEKVSAEQPLLTLVNLRRLEMAGTVGAHEVSQLRPGMAVTLNVEGDDTPVTGRLLRIAPSVDAGSRSIGVSVELANPQERWRAGQYAQAVVSLPGAAPVLAVPLTAVSSASGQDYVWVLEHDKLLRRSVTTGRRDTDTGWVEIKQGLAPQAQVLARRFDNLREGASARVQTAAEAAAPASAGAAASASH